MTSKNLKHLAKIGQLRREAPNEAEIKGLIASGREKLQDAQREDLAFSSRYGLAYSASHALALAALRFHGYRSGNRFQVFNCLTHTVQMPAAEVRVFGEAHRRRNVAEYEGGQDVDEAFLQELIELAFKLEGEVLQLVGQ